MDPYSDLATWLLVRAETPVKRVDQVIVDRGFELRQLEIRRVTWTSWLVGKPSERPSWLVAERRDCILLG